MASDPQILVDNAQFVVDSAAAATEQQRCELLKAYRLAHGGHLRRQADGRLELIAGLLPVED